MHKTIGKLYRREGVFLVDLADAYVLVDQTAGVMHSINPAAARAWSRLGQDPLPATFLEQLRDLDLLGQEPPDGPPPQITVCEDGSPPLILRSNMLLQVAASTPMYRGGWF